MKYKDEKVKPYETRLWNGHDVPAVEAIQLMERLLMDFYCLTIDGEEVIKGLLRCSEDDKTIEDPLDDGSASMLISLGYLRADKSLPYLVRHVVLSAVVWDKDRFGIRSPFAEKDIDRAYQELRKRWTWLPQKNAATDLDMAPVHSLFAADDSQQALTQLHGGAAVPRDSAIQAMLLISPLAVRKPIDTWPAWGRLMIPLYQVCQRQEIEGTKRKNLIRHHLLEKDGTPNLVLERVVCSALKIFDRENDREIELTSPFAEAPVHADYLRACAQAKVPIHAANLVIRYSLSYSPGDRPPVQRVVDQPNGRDPQ